MVGWLWLTGFCPQDFQNSWIVLRMASLNGFRVLLRCLEEEASGISVACDLMETFEQTSDGFIDLCMVGFDVGFSSLAASVSAYSM